MDYHHPFKANTGYKHQFKADTEYYYHFKVVLYFLNSKIKKKNMKRMVCMLARGDFFLFVDRANGQKCWTETGLSNKLWQGVPRPMLADLQE